MNASTHDEIRAILGQALSPERVSFVEAGTKDAVLRDMIDVLAASPQVEDKAALADAVFKREAIMSTGIGLGLAVPHIRIASVSELVMAVAVSKEGINDYASLDDKPVHLVFLIAAPEGKHVDYLRLLSAISTRAKDLNGRLLECADASAFHDILVNTESGSGGGTTSA